MTNIGYLQIIRKCNNKCVYCSNPNLGTVMPLDKIKKNLNELKNNGYTDVILTGGEPTIHPYFFEIIDIVKTFGLNPRIITNGLSFADFEFAKKCQQSGINIIHLSVYTYLEKLNDRLRKSKGSFKKMLIAMINLKKLNFDVQVTTVISSYNQNHILKTVLFINKINPKIKHFVFNILDPLMMSKNEDSLNSIPDLNTLTTELLKTFDYLVSKNFSFRIERVPLCKIPGYERANTEARKLVKNQNRQVFFLDQRENVIQSSNGFRHDYSVECKNCQLYNICSGVWMLKEFYSNTKFEPNKNKQYLNDIITKILN